MEIPTSGDELVRRVSLMMEDAQSAVGAAPANIGRCGTNGESRPDDDIVSRVGWEVSESESCLDSIELMDTMPDLGPAGFVSVRAWTFLFLHLSCL
jgi:hypothetical protein